MSYMGYFDNNRSGGKRTFGGRSSDRPTMHKATCSNCGKECEVPFRPTGSKPVYCRDCFAQQGGSDSRTANENNTPRYGNAQRTLYDAVCDNCQKRCKIPFQPTTGRPVFCSDCFETNGQTSRKPGFTPNPRSERQTEQPNYKEQFDMLNAKMDKILTLLNNTAPKTAKPTVTKAVEIETPTEIETVIEKTVELKKERKPRTKKATKTVKKTSTKKK